MTLQNTTASYGSVAKFLHWLIALLFLAAYCAVYYRHWFTEVQTDVWRTSGLIHRCTGLSIAAFVLLRIIWRRFNPPPELPSAKPWEHYSANFVHYALYFFMIAMPLTGYFGTGVNTDFRLFVIPGFEETQLYQWVTGGNMSFKEWEKPLDFFIGESVVHCFCGC